MLFLIFLTCFAVSCSGGKVVQPDGIWESTDGVLVIDFDSLTGQLQIDGETQSIDVLYSYTLQEIAFYSEQQELFKGFYRYEQDTVIIQNDALETVYTLSPKSSEKQRGEND